MFVVGLGTVHRRRARAHVVRQQTSVTPERGETKLRDSPRSPTTRTPFSTGDGLCSRSLSSVCLVSTGLRFSCVVYSFALERLLALGAEWTERRSETNLGEGERKGRDLERGKGTKENEKEREERKKGRRRLMVDDNTRLGLGDERTNALQGRGVCS